MNANQSGKFVIWVILLTLSSITVFAQQNPNDGIWTPVDKAQLSQAAIDHPALPSAYGTFRLNRTALETVIKQAAEKFDRADPVILTLPMPDGSLNRFEIEHSLVVEPGLLAKFPEAGATFRGQGIDDRAASVRFDLMPTGFHAIVLSAGDTVYIEPYALGGGQDYISFYHNDSPPDWFANECMVRGTDSPDAINAELLAGTHSPSVVSGANLKTYRLAVGATAEYTAAYGGGTVAGALTSIITTINFVDAIYERELSIHLVLVGDESSIIFTNTATDGYTHESIPNMLAENQAKLDAVIGPASYDIGHVFDGSILGGGSFSFQGQAGAIGNVCSSTGKAGGVDIFRSVSPGDVIAYYSVAHEFGHQFGATHMMNGTGTGCAGARTSFSAFEPGSGSTIMGYRFNCAAQDLRSSDTYFNNFNLDQIVTYTTSGTGVCAVPTATGNQPPTINAGGNFTIPKRTPFALTATGSDPDGDTVSYAWEEGDLGPASPPDTDADGQARPILRSFAPTTNPTRTFPSLTYILNNANVPPTSGPCPIFGGTCALGEALPTIGRTMNFRVTARDTRAIGAVNSSSMQVIVDGTSGPFAVTSPNSGVTYTGGSAQTITWDPAGTASAPVSTANVKISFSSDGGFSFPTVILASTPNDGTETVSVPNIGTTAARIKIEAVGNIYFDISDASFTVTAQSIPFAALNGRVFTPDNRGLRNAAVSVINTAGVKRTVLTNSFGIFSFDGVATGETYTITVSSKRYRFAAQSVQVSNNLVVPDFVGVE